MADCLNSFTSSEEIEKPNWLKWSTSHFAANDLSISTPIQKGMEAIIDRGLEF